MTIEEDERVRGDVVVIGAPARIDGEVSGDVLVVVALLASVVVFAGRGSVERIARCARTEPVKSGVVGFLTQVLFVPLLVAGILRLVISIVGIPLLLLLPFVVIAACLVMMVGFIGGRAWCRGLVRQPDGPPRRSAVSQRVGRDCLTAYSDDGRRGDGFGGSGIASVRGGLCAHRLVS